MSMLVINSFISFPGLGVLCAVLALYFVNAPEYLIPSMFVATYLDLDCFIFGNLTASRYLIIIYILFVLIKKHMEGSIYILRNVMLYFGIFLVYIILSSSLSPSGLTAEVITMILNILFVVFTASLFINKTEDIFDILQIGALEIIILLLTRYFSGVEINSNGSYALLSGTNNNEIGMALAQIGAVFISSYIIGRGYNSKLKQVLQIIGVILSLGLLLLTGSRSATFGLCAAVVITLIYDTVINGRDIRRLFGTLILFIVIISLGYYFIQSNEALVYRFTIEAVNESNGTGRFDIWKTVWEEIVLKKPLFGCGYGESNVQRVLQLNGINQSGTHNIVIDMLANLGVLGTIYILWGLIWIIKNSIRFLKGTPYLFCILIMLLAGITNGVGENIFSERFLWLDIGLLICMLYKIDTEDIYE